MEHWPNDVWIAIFRIIIFDWRNGAQYKILIQINRQIKSIGYAFHNFVKANLANHLLTLLKMYQNKKKFKKMEWMSITANPNISMKTIEENPDWPWVTNNICDNPNITWDFYKNKLPMMYANNKKDIKFRNYKKINALFDQKKLSKTLPWQIIEENIDLHWDWISVAQNSNVILDNLNLYITKFNKASFIHFTMNPNFARVDQALYFHNTNFTNWCYVSMSPYLDSNFIKNNPSYDWCYLSFLRYQNLEFIESYVMKGLDFEKGIYKNSFLIFDEECVEYLSQNPNLTIEFIRRYPDFNWNWHFITEGPNMTMEIIMANLDLAWDFKSISSNPNMTYEIISRNSFIKWNWRFISENTFNA
jgi:hypothetical protein